jgi:glucosyl-dolichyl phosphate glucuronosyltransferase
MNVTVILCTYNRSESLKKALESVANSTLSNAVEWEVLVVDNNSNDQTKVAVEEYCRRYPGRFRYLFEKQPGKSYALNAGIAEAQGEILAFVDDDVTVEPTWLQNLTAPLQDAQWAGTGGRIRPERNFSPPRWMLLEGDQSLGPTLAAVFDLGDTPVELTRSPYGTNMAFRKSMFAKHGGFRTDMGPTPGTEIRGEDVEFGRRLLAAGERLSYVPSAVVYHAVLEKRLHKEFFLNYWFAYGRTQIRERGYRPGKWGIPRYFFSFAQLGSNTLRWIRTVHPGKRFFNKCQVWMSAGKLVENYSQSREHKHDDPRELRVHETRHADK